MDAKITINAAAIKQIEQNAALALEQTAEALHTEIVQAQVIPRDTGNLQNESTIASGQFVTKTYDNGSTTTTGVTKYNNGKISIITTGPQARRLYYHPEYNFQKTENPNAKGKWFEDWEQGGKNADFAEKAFAKFMRRLTK